MLLIKTCWHDAVTLCRGKPELLAVWLSPDNANKVAVCLFWIMAGGGLYGAAIGLWRAPLQSLYVLLKLPLLIFLTTLGNALLNGMLAQILGAKISFRQSALAILMSFALAAIILGSLAPLALMLIYNSPPMGTEYAEVAHHLIILFNVAAIALAGVSANLSLLRLLAFITNSDKLARTILFSWLAVNLLMGGQLAWIMRPFIGTPDWPVEFFRAKALDGNFFEALLISARQLMNAND